ncbi:hypothetical protein KMT30_06765, partial [Streptomyces sp. IBSBF 2953]|nr:hypothetical protein [Streptomyces hayashii]
MADWADTRVSLAGQGTLRGRALSTASGGACSANIGGIQVTVRTVVGLTVAVGDTLLIQRSGSLYYAIAVAAAAPSTDPTPAPVDTTPDTGDTAPTPKPAVTTGSLTCAPVSTATYRDGSWRSDGASVNAFDTYQGRYAGSAYGRMTGCAFYGSKPRTLSGATVTKATVRLRRLTSGDFARRTATLRLVSQATRPSGAPTLNESAAG